MLYCFKNLKTYRDLPVIHCIRYFLSDGSQQFKLNSCLSRAVGTGLAVVHSFVIGPMLYNVMKTDLHTLSKLKIVLKYADDTTLLVSEIVPMTQSI